MALIFGKGTNDTGYSDKKDAAMRPIYDAWFSMLRRCYCSKSLKSRPSYSSCVVCDEWLNFSKFKEWMLSQGWKGRHLDKDILSLDCNIYSPSTCVFVSPSVNVIFSNHQRRKGGVSGLQQCSGKYTVTGLGSSYLGRFIKITTALKVRSRHNINYINNLNEDPRVIERLKELFVNPVL